MGVLTFEGAGAKAFLLQGPWNRWKISSRGRPAAVAVGAPCGAWVRQQQEPGRTLWVNRRQAGVREELRVVWEGLGWMGPVTVWKSRVGSDVKNDTERIWEQRGVMGSL